MKQFKEKELDLKEYCEMETFYNNFCDKLTVCDPLDRDIICEDENGVK